MKTKAYVVKSLCSLVLIAFVGITNRLIEAMQVVASNQIAANQLNNTELAPLALRMISNPLFTTGMVIGLAVILLFLWGKDILNLVRYTTHIGVFVLAVIITTNMIGCGPYQVEQFKEVAPNETAFVVPLEGANKTTQGKFMSVDYLEKAKVATKRIIIPTRRHDTGRSWAAYEWIPTVKVIKVDRTPQTRYWTQTPDTGTSKSNEAFCVESIESIDFCAGGVAIATIKEEDAAKFLYWYAGKPLDKVMDNDVRGFLLSVLSREFGTRALVTKVDKDGNKIKDSQGEIIPSLREDKAKIFAVAFKEAKDFFGPRGVTILQFGGSEGLSYKNDEIQKAINGVFIAENDKKRAIAERVAQGERNQLLTEKATAERIAAEEFAKAQDAQVAKMRLEIEKLKAEAMLIAAKKWNGATPDKILPQGSQFMFGLDAMNN